VTRVATGRPYREAMEQKVARGARRGLSALERSLSRVLEPSAFAPGESAEQAGSEVSPFDPQRYIYLHGYADERPRVPWPAFPPPGYLGQLRPEFQRRLVAERAFVDLDDCDFYHSAQLPSGEVIDGAWDLRGGEVAYLGGVDLEGRRVLELGPASGYLTFHMEARGADVVGFDVGWDRSIDLLPRPGMELGWARMDAMRFIGAVQNSWWYLHHEFGSSARIAYGNIYELPVDLGEFDLALFGAILLHLRDPFSALSQAAAHVRDQIIVTDLVQDPELDQSENLMRFAPQAVEYATNWWSLTPGAVVHMLERLGFGNSEVSFHTQRHHLGHDLSKPAIDMSMFTVVASRG
jgi:SAM-dependent methyltransferase